MNNVNERRKALRQALENHLTTYMGNKTQRNFKNVQAKIEAFINTYTEPVNGGAKPNNGGAKPNNGGAKPNNGGAKPNNGGAAAPLALPAPNNGGAKPNNGGNKPNNGGKPTLNANQITRLRQIKNNARTYNNVQFRNANAYVANLSKNHANHPNVVAARNALSARAASKLTQGAIEAVNTTPLNVGNISTNTKNKSNKYASISARLNTLTNAGNQRTFKVINALEREVMKNENSNARKAMLNKIENKRVKLQENNRAAKAAIEAREAANKAAANAAAAAKAAQNAKNAEAAANAERKAREAANKAAANAAEANAAAKKIAANAIASVIQKQAAANANAAAKKAAENAERAAQNAKKRANALLEESKKAEARNAAYAKYKNNITAANSVNKLGTINRNIAGANLNAPQKTNLRKMISIQQKKIEGAGKRAERALARAIQNEANLSRGSMNRYSRFREEINQAPSNKELNRLITVLGGQTGKLFSENERRNARAAINRKRNNLKGPGPSSSPNGGPKKSGGFFGAIGGIARGVGGAAMGVGGAALGAGKAVGGAALGGAKAVGGAALGAAKAVSPYVRVGVNVNLSRKAKPKIPNTKIGNNKPVYSESSHMGLGWNKRYVQHVRNSGNII